MYVEIIKKEFERSGLSQKELADSIHVSPQTISKILNNLVHPTIEQVKAMGKVFRVNLVRKNMQEERKTKKPNRERHILLADLNTHNRGMAEAKLILEESRIENHYPYSVCKLLEWFITATIGLTYHLSLKQLRPGNKEVDYDDIFFYLNNYFETCSEYSDQYKNQIEYDFSVMCADYYESYTGNESAKYEYCRDSLWDWYRFKKSFNTDLKKDFDVALAEIIANNSIY